MSSTTSTNASDAANVLDGGGLDLMVTDSLPHQAIPAGDEPILLTPGPLTTSGPIKAAMLRDWGSRDTDFIDMNQRVRRRLVSLTGGDEEYVCVPLQGSGTFAIEATLGTLLPPDGELLMLVNGVYGRRMARMCDYWGRSYQMLETPENVPNDPSELDRVLEDRPGITHVAAVHCETTSGILNPLTEIADVVSKHGRRLIVDAMSTFGALDLNSDRLKFEAVVASANKCLEGIPGVGFAITRREALEKAAGNSPSLALDLHDQWKGLESNGQWRFTPPTHVIAALDRALDELDAEGGVEARRNRYSNNCRIVVDGLRKIGFESALRDEVQAPIITTWYSPRDPVFSFETLYQRLAERGFLIYPGKLTQADTFRIGCIGRLHADQMREAVAAFGQVVDEMGVTEFAPS